MTEQTWTLIALTHAGATLCMMGLIWFVQIVHYPLMRVVGRDRWVDYEARHQARTTLVVAPLMLLEALSAAALLAGPQRGVVSIAGVILLAAAWLSTWMVQVPLHRRLSARFDDNTHRRLVRSNWIRTLAWSARGVLSLAMIGG